MSGICTADAQFYHTRRKILMIRGELFELECLEYLQNKYRYENVHFHHNGGMDSTMSDISVIKNGKVAFFIEVKDNTAQSGQFVVHPDADSHSFGFSSKNHSIQNPMTYAIIDYMNNDFYRFYNAGTAGAAIDIDSSVFAGWIIGHYQQRNVRYIISHDYNYVILPIRKFAEYFSITASCRIKGSGSSKPAEKDYDFITQAIKQVYKNAIFFQNNKKLYASISEPVYKKRFPINSNIFYLSDLGNDTYEIRKLSNTRNMTVIFSIKLKKSQDINDLAEFKIDLK